MSNGWVRWGKLFVVGASVGGLAACELIDDVLGYLSRLDLLGVVPASGYSNPGSPDYGKVTFTLTGRDDLGGAVAPLLSELEVVDEGGTPVKSDGGQEVPGNTVGSFLLVADGSGSTEADFYCSGCPTDPDRIRVEAVRALALQLDDCDWRMSLVEFGRDPYPAVRPNAVVADWTMDGEELAAAADGLSSGWTTPLWDAVLHGLERLDDDNQQSYEFPAKAGRGIVIVSDGVDTASSHTLNDAVEAAVALGLPVHTVGFGPASDTDDLADNAAVEGLRKLAEGTGGTYGYVSDVADLPPLAEAIGAAMCGGYTQIDARYDEPAPSGTPVTGFVRLKSQPEFGVPFTFRAP